MPRQFADFRAFAQFLAFLEATSDAKLRAIATTTVSGVKRRIEGIYGDEERLAPLAESTIAEKKRQGYSVPFPLIRTGVLRESTRAEIVKVSPGHIVAAVGSDNPIAFYH